MISFRFPPAFMVITPSSHPLITWPTPATKLNGSFRSAELSNFFPSIRYPV